jgi:hypothetical protein
MLILIRKYRVHARYVILAPAPAPTPTPTPTPTYLWLYSPLDLGRFFSLLIFYTVGWTPWTGDQPVARPLPTHRTTRTQNKRLHTSMPQVGFEPKILVFERAKTVHALERAATVTCNDFSKTDNP